MYEALSCGYRKYSGKSGDVGEKMDDPERYELGGRTIFIVVALIGVLFIAWQLMG